MISSMQIHGYRGFDRFEMNDLGRLNLLVGPNNSGKTSALEALYLLTTRGDPMALWHVLFRRGERVPGAPSPRRPIELDVCHLFNGHETHVGSEFTFSAENQTPRRSIAFSIGELTAKERSELIETFEEGPIPSSLVLNITGAPTALVPRIPLTRNGAINPDALESPQRRFGRRRSSEESQSQFITAESLDSDDLVSLWDKVALTPNEELVLQALRFLEPDVERIAAQAITPAYYRGSRGGFIIKQKGHDQPIPIGSMGDGMWRMLALTIAITQCKGGLLLVDEIDTGLHYTVMSDMWRLIFSAAEEFDVQVFATTHSFDCIDSLANVCMSKAGHEDAVTLQRIEIGKRKAIPYTESEIKVAAERRIEVR